MIKKKYFYYLYLIKTNKYIFISVFLPFFSLSYELYETRLLRSYITVGHDGNTILLVVIFFEKHTPGEYILLFLCYAVVV